MSVYRQSWALVIGINDYPDHPLAAAADDAIAIAERLKQLDFTNVSVLLNRDASLANLRRTIFDDIGARAQENDRVVVYFAGHGLYRHGRNGNSVGYLVPAN